MRLHLSRAVALLLVPLLITSPSGFGAARGASVLPLAPTPLFGVQALAEPPGGMRFVPSMSARLEAQTLCTLKSPSWNERVRPWIYGLATWATALLVVRAISHPVEAVTYLLSASTLFAMLSQRITLDQSLSMSQTLEQKLVLAQTLKGGAFGNHLEQEVFLIRLWEDALAHGRIRYAVMKDPDLEVPYALINDKDLTGYEKTLYHQLIRNKGPAFSHSLFDEWPDSFDQARKIMARGQRLIFVEENVFAPQDERYAAIHELGEMATAGNHHLATKLELSVAQQDNRLVDYLTFYLKKLPEKIMNAFADRTFGPRQDADPDLAELMTLGAIDPLIAEALRRRMELFRWPAEVLDRFKDYQATNRRVEKVMSHWTGLLTTLLSNPPGSHFEKQLDKANIMVNEMFKQIRDMNLSSDFSEKALADVWRKQIVEFGKLYVRQLAAYRNHVGSDSQDYQTIIQQNKTDLLRFGVFNEDIDYLLHPDRRLSADERLKTIEDGETQLSLTDDAEKLALTIQRLGELQAESAIERLIPFCRHASEKVRLAAVQALGVLALQAPVVQRYDIVAALAETLAGQRRDPSPELRDAALVAFSLMPFLTFETGGGATPDTLASHAVRAALGSDSDLRVKTDAGYLLLRSTVDGAELIADQLQVGDTDETREFNRAALRLLANRNNFLTPDDEGVLRRLEDYRDQETDPSLQAMAQEVLNRMNTNEDLALRRLATMGGEHTTPQDGDRPRRPIVLNQTVKMVSNAVSQNQGPSKQATGKSGLVKDLITDESGKTIATVELIATGQQVKVPADALTILKQSPKIATIIQSIEKDEEIYDSSSDDGSSRLEMARNIVRGYDVDDLDPRELLNVIAEVECRLSERTGDKWVVLMFPRKSRHPVRITNGGVYAWSQQE